MTDARRVVVVPAAPLSEEAIVAAATAVGPTTQAVRAGDRLGDLIVIGVDPSPVGRVGATTEVEVLATPRSSLAPRVDVAVLVDASESMGLPWDAAKTRLDAAFAALSSFLSDPGAAVEEVTVYEYSKGARVLGGPAAPAALALGARPTPRGSSATGTALNAALAGLAARTRPGVAQVVFLLTDGVGEVAEVLLAAERAGRLCVPVHSLVFAPEVDEVFHELTRLAGGSVQRATHPLTIEFVHQPGGE